MKVRERARTNVEEVRRLVACRGYSLSGTNFQGGRVAISARANGLTQRQQEVLGLVRRGRTNREIAHELGITEDGVKAHLSRLFLRFGATNRVELLAAANLDPSRDAEANGTLSLG